ncbi:hemolysin family protein [Dokdonella sp. MW10]|uniref:hemolysin family protein n=1 Tax=Dokdonella sp. MW10 TaxID=2992926 RepID=UPI003F81A90E
MEIALLAALILFNGIFSMSEIALVTSRRSRLQALADNGDRGAASALALGEDPTRFLSTVQIGITSIGILSGIAGEAALAEPLRAILTGYGVQPGSAGWIATTIVVATITYFSIVVGELVPKRFGQTYPETVARTVAMPMSVLAIVAKPFVMLLSVSTKTLLRILGIRQDASSVVTEEDIHAMLREGSEAGVIEHDEHAIVRNVFRLDDRQIVSLMVPRMDVVYLDLDAPEEVNRAILERGEHNRLPVVRGGLHLVVGIVSARHLLSRSLRGEPLDIEAHMRPAVFIPESLTGMELLQEFRRSGVEVIFVVDEYANVQGIVTQHDLLEAITGEFTPSAPEDAWAIQREDGSWLLDGLIPLQEFKDRLDLRHLPEGVHGRYHTLNGLFMLLLGRMPHTTDRLEWEGWRFEVVDMDGNRIDKVLAERVPEPVAAEVEAQR